MWFIENINDNINAKKKLNDNDEKIVKEPEPEKEKEKGKKEKENLNENDQKGKDKIIVEEKKEPKKEIKEKPENKYAEMYNKDNLNNAKGLFENVEEFGEFTKNNNNIKITTADQVSTALNAIKSIGENAGYKDASNSRKTFLGAVAKYLGIDTIGNLQAGVYNGNNQLEGKFVDNPAAEFLMHLRNLIAYGLGYKKVGKDAMPGIGLFETLSNKIKTQIKDMGDVSDNLEKMIQESADQVYQNALNVINDFDIRYDNNILASKNFENFKSQIEIKCKNNKVYLVLFGELFEKLEIICRAVDNKTGKK